MEKEENRDCHACGGELHRFEHRTPGYASGGDLTTCFNGIPKESHICAAECIKVGKICSNCRLLQGDDTFEHHPERSEWIKRDGIFIRKEAVK